MMDQLCEMFNRINKYFGAHRVRLESIGTEEIEFLIDGWGRFTLLDEWCVENFWNGFSWNSHSRNANAQFVLDIASGKWSDSDGNMHERTTA